MDMGESPPADPFSHRTPNRSEKGSLRKANRSTTIVNRAAQPCSPASPKNAARTAHKVLSQSSHQQQAGQLRGGWVVAGQPVRYQSGGGR
ncbi:MAG TPA: hypothetical protein VG123_34310, partial [Streptosporangiaceae bacterium]|nr:hypothetical protein [Streptosporangiaceae bacterium]